MWINCVAIAVARQVIETLQRRSKPYGTEIIREGDVGVIRFWAALDSETRGCGPFFCAGFCRREFCGIMHATSSNIPGGCMDNHFALLRAAGVVYPAPEMRMVKG